MNIWILNNNAIPPSLGGLCRHYYFKKYLEAMGHTVRIFTASQIHNSDVNMINGRELFVDKKVDGLEYTFIRSRKYKGNGLARMWNLIEFPFNMLKVCNKFSSPDIIYASTSNLLTAFFAVLFARKKKLPCVTEIRDLWPEAVFFYGILREKGIFGRVLTAIEHWTYQKSNALIFTKEGDIDHLKERGWLHDSDISPDKCYYINNGVDLEEFNYAVGSAIFHDDDLESEKFNVVYCGAIRFVNNVGNLLDAAALLKNHPDIQFLIFGQGVQLPELRRRVGQEDLTNIRLKGFVERKYIPYILSKSSLNILNYSGSKYNWARGNSSNKLFEYMASGKPILSTVKMGYCLLGKYNCGMSISEDTPEALADAILKIKNMSEAQLIEMGNNARRAAQDFDYKVLSNKLETILCSVVEKQ